MTFAERMVRDVRDRRDAIVPETGMVATNAIGEVGGATATSLRAANRQA